MSERARRLGLLLAACATLALVGSLGTANGLPAGSAKVGMICAPGTVSGGTHTFNLVAGSGDIQTPDGNQVFMWSYADADDADPTLRTFQYPGPVLCVSQGETVVVNLKNNLTDPTSIVFPGQDTEVTATGGSPGTFTREAAASGGMVTYTFSAANPGTYLYESGTDVSRQVEMGQYGALVVRPNAVPAGGTDSNPAHYAYGSAGTVFDPAHEYMLLLAEIDPELHHIVETGGAGYDFTKLHNRYFTINGRSFPDTVQDNDSSLLPTQPYGALVRVQPTGSSDAPALVRMLNAGVDNHPVHPHGNHTREIAQDGRLLLSPGGARASTERFGESIGAGQTRDYQLRWDQVSTDSAGHPFNDSWDPNSNPFPLPPPNYLNVTFKDGNTYYSGSPYLGYKGTLPSGTVSQNVCGEWYFPLHSHALNEFTNFDEGFGGMGTLLRVDPYGGCFAFPTSTRLQTGTLNTGTVTRLAVDDTSYYKLNSASGTTDWYGQFSAIPAGAAKLKVTYKGNSAWSPYTQNLNALAATGTSSTVPAGWAFSETGTGANGTYSANNGGSATGDTYSYGATGNSERALGGLRTSAVVPTIGYAFTNTTGGPVTSLTISYTGEQWRYGGGGGSGPDRLDFQYSADATSLTTGTWTDVNAGDFSSRITTGAVRALNGNASASRAAVTFTFTVSIPAGATRWIRWSDFDRGGTSVADDGLAVDDFSLTPTGGGVPTTVSIWNWSTSSWTQVAGPMSVGETDAVVANNTLVAASPPGSWANYRGTGTNKGVVRVRVLSQAPGTSFVTGANLMKLVYDMP